MNREKKITSLEGMINWRLNNHGKKPYMLGVSPFEKLRTKVRDFIDRVIACGKWMDSWDWSESVEIHYQWSRMTQNLSVQLVVHHQLGDIRFTLLRYTVQGRKIKPFEQPYRLRLLSINGHESAVFPFWKVGDMLHPFAVSQAHLTWKTLKDYAAIVYQKNKQAQSQGKSLMITKSRGVGRQLDMTKVAQQKNLDDLQRLIAAIVLGWGLKKE